MYNNLTKENFFNSMTEKYPQTMTKFCAWVDQYKKDNFWSLLFNDDVMKLGTKEEHVAPKYHELPLALQMGIFTEWVWSMEPEQSFLEEVKELMEEVFDDLEYPEQDEEDNDGNHEGIRNSPGEEVQG